MTTAKNVMVGTSTYQKQDTGETKTNWTRVGKIITKDDGKQFFVFDDVVKNYLKGLFGDDWGGTAAIFEPQDNNRQRGNAGNDTYSSVSDEDLPF